MADKTVTGVYSPADPRCPPPPRHPGILETAALNPGHPVGRVGPHLDQPGAQDLEQRFRGFGLDQPDAVIWINKFENIWT